MKEARPELYRKLELESMGAPKDANTGKAYTFPAMDRIIAENKWVCPIKQMPGDNCYYSMSKDEIVVVTKENFKDGESFYGTCWHEMAHSTGAESRLGRLTPSKFGSKEYAIEELVAELTAALTAQRYGVEKIIKNDSVPYIRSWLESLKESPEYIKSVLTEVKKAAHMLHSAIDAEMQNDNKPTGGDDSSPDGKLIRQYRAMKEKHPDALLLFRKGDFYESYEEDAVRNSEILGTTLTSYNVSKIKMTAFPYHKLDMYLPKLIRKGYRVAICDCIDPQQYTKLQRAARNRT